MSKPKEARLTDQERQGREIGDQYVFVALDAETKLVPSFAVGKWDGETALSFLADLQRRLNGNDRIQLTTVGLNAYLGTMEEAFGANVDYAQLVKLYWAENPGPGRYAPPRVSEVVSTPITGNPNPQHISTSYVERHNLTIRMQIRRFTRLTNAFSKKLANLKAALVLYFAHYNFVRIHGTLRITSAMADGVADRVWTLADLMT